MALALNYDILAELIPYLSAEDALSLGATNSLLHQLAMRHALSDVQFGSPFQLDKFCLFVFRDTSRLPLLRKLTLHNGINAQSKISALGSLIPLLFRANNLVSLTLPQSLDYILMSYPALSQAISKLSNLTSLTLSSYGSHVQAMLLELRSASTLRHLVVAAEPWIYQNRSAEPLALPFMPALQTLVLVRISCRRPQETLSAAAPALRSLQLTHISYGRGDELISPGEGTWWTSLEHIRGDVHSLMPLRTSRPLHALEVDVTLSQMFSAVGHPTELLDVIKTAPPQRLSIAMQASYNRHLCHWPSAPSTPPLRYLELFVVDTNPASHDLDPKRWLVRTPVPLFTLTVFTHVHAASPLTPRAKEPRRARCVHPAPAAVPPRPRASAECRYGREELRHADSLRDRQVSAPSPTSRVPLWDGRSL